MSLVDWNEAKSSGLKPNGTVSQPQRGILSQLQQSIVQKNGLNFILSFPDNGAFVPMSLYSNLANIRNNHKALIMKVMTEAEAAGVLMAALYQVFQNGGDAREAPSHIVEYKFPVREWEKSADMIPELVSTQSIEEHEIDISKFGEAISMQLAMWEESKGLKNSNPDAMNMKLQYAMQSLNYGFVYTVAKQLLARFYDSQFRRVSRNDGKQYASTVPIVNAIQAGAEAIGMFNKNNGAGAINILAGYINGDLSQKDYMFCDRSLARSLADRGGAPLNMVPVPKLFSDQDCPLKACATVVTFVVIDLNDNEDEYIYSPATKFTKVDKRRLRAAYGLSGRYVILFRFLTIHGYDVIVSKRQIGTMFDSSMETYVGANNSSQVFSINNRFSFGAVVTEPDQCVVNRLGVVTHFSSGAGSKVLAKAPEPDEDGKTLFTPDGFDYETELNKQINAVSSKGSYPYDLVAVSAGDMRDWDNKRVVNYTTNRTPASLISASAASDAKYDMKYSSLDGEFADMKAASAEAKGTSASTLGTKMGMQEQYYGERDFMLDGALSDTVPDGCRPHTNFAFRESCYKRNDDGGYFVNGTQGVGLFDGYTNNLASNLAKGALLRSGRDVVSH